VTKAQRLVILGVMCSIFLASMEGTVVATAMPTIVSQLGGLATYSWVFAAYMLAATTPVPLYGKLSDLYGRRPLYAVAMGLFLLGSLLSAQAASMPQLIAFRVVQGLGAGGLLTLAFIIIGALLSFEQRARMTGLFASVWGVSSIIGPLLGGFIVDHLPWPWIFYINLPPGLIAFLLIRRFWVDEARPQGAAKVQIDYLGAILLSAGVVALLLGLFELRAGSPGPLLLLAGGLFVALLVVERRAADPVLPLALFRERLFAVACAHGVGAGWATFGSIAFVPLFVQGVLGTSATAAGAALTPLSLSWTLAAIISTRLLLRMGYRPLALAGVGSLTAGALALVVASAQLHRPALIGAMILMGAGMGLSTPSLLIAVQTSVQRSALGTATSMLQFGRTIGGSLGVSVMGALLNYRLAAGLAVAIQPVFGVALLAAIFSLIATTLAPGGRIAQLAARRDAPGGPAATPAAKTTPAP
jgi:EmrB/QacA subfamily drug resistance transporter